MKTVEDIEKMDLEALEKAALEENAPVPEGLTEHILGVLAAESVTDKPDDSARPRNVLLKWIPAATVAAAAIVAAVVLFPREKQLRDTYDDPYLAYAEVERAFQLISDKMSIGVSLTEQAAATAGKPREIIDRINTK